MPTPKSLLERAFSLLSVFSVERPAVTLSELSRHSGLPLSTTHRLVASLVELRALDRTPDGRYCVGLRLLELGALSPGSLDLRDRAVPFLEDLYEVTRHNVQLAVRDGAEVVYVERISARDAVNVVTRVGSRMPLHCTGVGLVLLAAAPVAVQESVLASPLKRYTPKTIVSAPELRETLARVRRDGYAISDRQIEMITYSVAAPVRDQDGEVVGAVSAVVPTGTRTDTVVPAVRTCGLAISRALGWVSQ